MKKLGRVSERRNRVGKDTTPQESRKAEEEGQEPGPPEKEAPLTSEGA